MRKCKSEQNTHTKMEAKEKIEEEKQCLNSIENQDPRSDTRTFH